MRGHRHQQPVLVVEPFMRMILTVAIEAHLEGRHLTRRGLVHVVPNTGNTGGDVARIELTPPSAGLWLAKVREGRPARPNLADIQVACLRLAERIPGEALIEHLVTRF